MSYIEEKFKEVEEYVNGTSSDKILEVRSVFTKEQSQNIEPCKNQSTGWWAGVERLSDEEKKSRNYYVTVGLTGTSGGPDDCMHNTKIKLQHGYKFDLNTEVGKTNWEWAKWHPALETSFKRAQASKANYYIHIDGKESEDANVAADLEYEAIKCIMEDDSAKYLNRALLLGHDLEGETSSALKEFLIDTAKDNPKKIIELYRDKDMRMKLLFVQAKKYGIITIEGEDNIISFGRINLGVTEKAALLYLRENPQVVELIERQVKPDYFDKQSSKSEVTPGDLARSMEDSDPMPTYMYMKKRAIELGHDGSMKKNDLINYFLEKGYVMADMKAEEDEAAEAE